MGYMCDFCGEQRSMVHCRSDAACLCLSCDRNVHSANALSKRHSRTLICERCNAQPASVRCTDERVSLCQNCDWLGHNGATNSHHKKQTINCYSGCPSSEELASIWSFCLDLDLDFSKGGQSACEQGMGLMTIDEGTGEKRSGGHDANVDQPGTSSAAQEKSTLAKGLGVSEDDYCGNLIMDEMDLAFEKYDELFGTAYNSSKDLFEHGGIESLFEKHEGKTMQQPAESNAASGDSFMTCRTEPIICFTSQPAHSNISFSGATGEGNNAGDFQDCGVSSMQQLSKETPLWCPPTAQEISATTRNNAVIRYKEKKKARNDPFDLSAISREILSNLTMVPLLTLYRIKSFNSMPFCRFRMAHTADCVSPRDVCIVGVARTPMGGFLGSLSSLPATKLGSVAIAAALKRANVDPSLVQEVVFGNVLSANLGQAPARQAALGAGIPNSVICTTVNKVCASGMKAVMIAAQSIQLGINDVVVAGGMESMSNTPKYLAEARKGSRFGNDSLVDGMLKDGLWDVYNDCGMGSCAELCAEKFQITREQQDDYAVQSFERGIAAKEAGAFTWEIVPVEVSGGRGRPSTIVDKDEGLGKFDAAKLRKLRPSFKDNGGTVTAGNASSISDGAAALVLVSGEKALQLGLKVLAKVKGYGDAAQEPEFFTTAPALAIPKAIAHAGLESSQVDYYEINEAFAVVALANQKLLGITPEKVNVNGGAVSLGHPLGCSGARILITLLGILKNRNGKYGVGGVCNGGGGASALVLELV
ncbi:unnamed protein product [Brassica oleracea var. botrytis]